MNDEYDKRFNPMLSMILLFEVLLLIAIALWAAGCSFERMEIQGFNLGRTNVPPISLTH